MRKFKVNDRVVNTDIASKHVGTAGVVVRVGLVQGEEYIHVKRDDGVRGSGDGGAWTARASSYELEIPKQAEAADWSYGEAERLYQAASEAIEAYNKYVERKPTTNYLSASLPSKW